MEKGPEAPGKRHAADFMGTTPSGGTGSWGLGQGPTAPLFAPNGGSRERQEELGENREAIPGGAQCRALEGGVTWGAGAQPRQAELVPTVALSSGSCSIRTPPSKAFVS